MANSTKFQDVTAPAKFDGTGDIDVGAVGRALWRKKWWAILPAFVVGALAFAGVNTVAPRYKSETRLIIDGRENVFLRPEADKSGERDRSAVDQEAITSQVQLALSREVARQVIARLKLGEVAEFDPLLKGIGRVKQALIAAGLTRDPLKLSPEERVFESYYERVTAFQVEKSRVLSIEFQSENPELAAQGANAVADAYLALLQSSRQDQTRAAGDWLAGEIETLRARVAQAESRAEQFRSKSNLFVGPNNNSLSNQQLGEVNSQIAAARSQKAELDVKARAIRDMLRSGRAVESGDIINSESIRRLNEQRVTLRAQLAEQSSTLLSGHPRIKELKAQIADLEGQIRSEAERLIRSLENDATVAAGRVEQLTANLEQLKVLAASGNSQDVQLRALEREAKSERDLLESYLAKYREASARQNLGTSSADARVISRAMVSNTPFFPKKLPIILIASLATLLLMAGLIATSELLRGSAAVTAVSKMGDRDATDPVVAPTRVAATPTVQEMSPDISLASIEALAERLAAQPVGKNGAVLIASTDAHGGQRTTADLLRALGRRGRTIAIDIAKPSESGAQLPPVGGAVGIFDLIEGRASFGNVIGRDGNSRGHVVSAGNLQGDYAAALASNRLTIALNALAHTYDFVLLHGGRVTEAAAAQLRPLATIALVAASSLDDTDADASRRALLDAGFENVSLVSTGEANHKERVSSAA